MEASSFIGYVGVPDFHDGTILAVKQADESVSVQVRGASGKYFIAEFCGVHALRSNNPEGMLLYSLSEMSSGPSFRRFVFANSDEDSTATLEIDAEKFRVYEDNGV